MNKKVLSKDPYIKVIDSELHKEKKKILEQFLNHEYARHKKFIEAVTIAKLTIEKMYGHEAPSHVFENIIDAYMDHDLELISKKHE